MTIKIRKAIESGTFAPWDEKPAGAVISSAKAANTPATNPIQVAYSCHGFVQAIAERVSTTAKRRYYDLYLLASWVYTVLVTAVVFGFAHFGLHKVAPGSYTNAVGVGFWSFLGYSVSILTKSNVSKISPVSAAANVFSYGEVVCSLVILVILFFMLLTGAREAFKDNLDEFTAELGGVAKALEARIVSKWEVSISELEVTVLAENPSMVNYLRKLRGLPELSPPSPQTTAEAQDTGSTENGAV